MGTGSRYDFVALLSRWQQDIGTVKLGECENSLFRCHNDLL